MSNQTWRYKERLRYFVQ